MPSNFLKIHSNPNVRNSKNHQYLTNLDGFKDIVYYPALLSYVILDIKGENFKLWKLNPETNCISLLRFTQYSSVKFGNFFKVSEDGQILYLNYSDKGIQVIDASCDNFLSFQPSRTINCPENDEFVDIVPLKNHTKNWLLIATKKGHLCLLNEEYKTVASYSLNLRTVDRETEQISCISICPHSKNIVIASQVYSCRAQKQCSLYWLEINHSRSIKLLTSKDLL